MRAGIYRMAVVIVAAGVLAGCGSTTNSGGSSSITLTDESRQIVLQGNQCAIQGTATNVGNLTVNVTIRYEALNVAGVPVGSSSAEFQVAPFSDFAYGPTKLNHLGQPSSGPFTNGLSCLGFASFVRVFLDVSI